MNNNTNNQFNDRYNNFSDDGNNNNIYSNSNPYHSTATENSADSSRAYHSTATENSVNSNPYHSMTTENSVNSNPYHSTTTENSVNSNPYHSTTTENSVNSNPYHSTTTGYQPESSEYSYVYQRKTSSVSQPKGNISATQNPYGDNVQNVYASPKKSEKKKTRKSSFLLKAIVAGLCFGIVAGSVMVGINYAGNKLTTSSSNNTIATTSSLKTVNDNNSDKTAVSTTYDVASVAEKVMPAMVSINIKGTKTVQNPYSDYFNFGFGFGGNDSYQQEVSGSGSGIIISQNSSELLIVTNNHVVEDANEINITFNDKSTYSAKVKGTEADYDLAVVSVKVSDLSQDTKDKIAVATLGDSNKLKLGQPAVAIGNALGYGQSVTVGYISALEREVQMTDNTMTLIQTDAAINPGNSGGALLDMNGNVIGINSAKYSDTDVEGMGYAIPISDATPIIEDLMNNTNHADSRKAYLGIAGTDVTDNYSQSFGLPSGVYISKVTSGSPADNAGIQAGDILTKFDGNEVKTMSSLQAKLKGKKPNDSVEITVQRQQRNGGYKEVTVTVKLGAKSDAPTED